jgi:GNAT superfamily N-acetyltransferase
MTPPLIRPLAESQHVAEVAGWLHAQWWANEGWTLAETAAWLAAATGPAAPLTLVAEAAGRPLGTATLDTEDLPSRPDLSPWLASVLVRPEARRRGIATALVAAVEHRAKHLGHRELWLYTTDQAGFYAARGWLAAGEAQNRGVRVALMRRILSSV